MMYTGRQTHSRYGISHQNHACNAVTSITILFHSFLPVGWQERQLACVKLDVGLLVVVVTIWSKLCTSYSSSCTTSIILSSNKIQNGDVLVVAMEVKVTTGAKACKAPVKSSPPTNQQPVFLQAGCPSCRPTVSEHWRTLHSLLPIIIIITKVQIIVSGSLVWRFSVAVTLESLSTQLLYIESG